MVFVYIEKNKLYVKKFILDRYINENKMAEGLYIDIDIHTPNSFLHKFEATRFKSIPFFEKFI